ncbi:MAG: M28 family peptidase, partial [Bryobacteraceae bacterium]
MGLLRGSDPALKNTYILLTAHYDHIGMKPSGEGDRIYNGANDDGSGTVSVIEIADALSRLKPAPKRSILFMTFFGEEEGGFGSEHYARHPLFPLADTIADVNLEQLGRTDSTDGPQVGTATFTGFDYSDLPEIFQTAGDLTGIKVYKDGKGSDDYFDRSDNQELADAGVPSHTLAVAFDFPGYHD